VALTRPDDRQLMLAVVSFWEHWERNGGCGCSPAASIRPAVSLSR